MKFVNLTRQELDEFSKQKDSHITQLGVHYDLKQHENIETHIVGVKENNDIIAACLLTATPVMKVFKYFYTNRGPVLDFSNKTLVMFFFKELKNYAKQNKGLFLRVDPYVMIHKRTHDGNIIETNEENLKLIDELKTFGYQHQGFIKGSDSILQIRFHSVLDLSGKDEESVLKDMDHLRKRNIKKVLKNGVKVKFLTKDELHIFRNFMRDTSEMKDFFDREDAFYTNRMDYYGEHVLAPMAYIDFKAYIPELTSEQVQLEKNIAKYNKEIEKKPDQKKYVNMKREAEQRLVSIKEKLKEAQELQAVHGDTLPISAAFYFVSPYEVIYHAGGTSKEFRHFAGSYAVQWTMIKYALEHGIDRYNFYGITGDFSKDAEDAGVVQFKKGFNADVIEYIGDFIAPINAPAYKAYSLIKKIKR